MRHNLILVTLCLLLTTVAGAASAQNDRQELLRRIVAAQGLEVQFEQQVQQQAEAVRLLGKQILDRHARAAGREPNASERAALERLVSRASGIFSSQELIDAWMSGYEKNLSVQDLAEILRYYESPIGRKDVGASKAAMSGFTRWVLQQEQSRSTAIISAFRTELLAARE